MDTKREIRRLSAELRKRGSHRLLGNQSLGTFNAFLTSVFLIRIAANLYMAIERAFCAEIEAVQIASAHIALLSGYIILVGSLSSFRLSYALPQQCFSSFASQGKRFRSRFLFRIAFVRPMNIAALSLIIFTAFIFSWTSGSWPEIMPRAAIALFASSTGIAVVHAAASWTKPRRSETEILETLYLLFFLGLRADIGPFENRVSILFAGYHHPFHGLWEIAVIAVSAVVLALLMLVILKAFSALSRFSFIQSSSHPMDRWYREVIRKEYWGLLYLCVIPIFISASIPSTIKRGFMVLSALFAASSYLYFLILCENTLYEKWRCSLRDKKNMRLLLRSALLHLTLLMIPLLIYIIS